MQKISKKRVAQNEIRQYGTYILAAFALSYIFLSPSVTQILGNTFFGENKYLHNVNLAQFFFEQSAYPLLGGPVLQAHYQLSRTYFIQGRLKEALSEVEKEIAIYPENTQAYYILGLTYGYLNDEKRAIDAFSVFIERNPSSWAARNDKAWLQFRIGDIDGALATMEPVAHDTENAWVQNTYGTLLLNKGRHPEAKEAFLNAKRIADTMTDESWGRAYPGNDPRIYSLGLKAMKSSIESNLKLTENRN